MHKKEFADYKKFLSYANENVGDLSNIKYFGGRLFSYNTKSYRCKFLTDSDAVTPNMFVRELGFFGYSAFVNKRFSKLSEYAETKKDVNLWWSGYFGGLIGINERKINDFLATGEIYELYDYDINSAYLHALTQFLPTKFIKTMAIEDFESLNEVDKIPFIYFFELEFKTIETRFLRCVGTPKGIYNSFDFLSSKQNNAFICSEKRLSLINQIYHKQYKIKKVFVFERGRFRFYENILTEYLKQKNDRDEAFKKNALRLYGTLGQIYKYTPKALTFEENGDLKVITEQIINWNSCPHVAMFVSDIVAERLFNIISNNFDNVLSWCVDGFTATKKIGVKLSKRGGDWKMKKIVGFPILLNKGGKRIIYKDFLTGKIYGSDCITEKDGTLTESVMLQYSNLKKGFVKKTSRYKIKLDQLFDWSESFRGIIWRQNHVENILCEEINF